MGNSDEHTPGSVLDFQAVGRVVGEVRKADISLGGAFQDYTTGSPAEVDRVRHIRADLSRMISWAYTARDVHGDWTSDSRARRRYDALLRTRRLARELIALIQDDQLPLTSSLASCFRATDEHGLHVVDFSQLMVGLERLQEAAEKERTRLKRADLHETAPLSHVEGESAPLSTPGNAFITKMGKVFEDAFGQAPSIKFTTAREPDGPFVQFVAAVTKEMGQRMSLDAIRKAWDRSTTGQR